MQAPATPKNESNRIAALCALEILDTDPEERFDRVTRIAKSHFKVSIALVSLVDTERQWFKSKQGLQASETPRSISFCGHAILGNEVLNIPNALEDERFKDNPLVTGPPNIRFYAGAPLHAPSGEAIGTLCIIDDKPKTLSTSQVEVLRDLADIVESELAQGHLLKVELGLKNSTESLMEYAKRLSLATRAGGIGIWEFIPNTQVFHWDEQMFQIFGHNNDSQTTSYNHWFSAIHPKDKKKVESEFKNSIANNHLFDTTFRVVWPNHEIRHIKISALLVDNKQISSQKMIGVHLDITSTKEMEISAKFYESIIQSSHDAIVSRTSDGLISSWNKGAEVMFGYLPQEIIGSSVNVLLPNNLKHEEQLIINKILSGESINNFETTRLTKSGNALDISASFSPIIDDDGAIAGISTIARDISEQKQLEKLQSQFVSTVSHELRTPLTSIRGSLGLVLGKNSESLTTKNKHLLEIAMRNSERLSLLINDILDLEKLQSNLLEFSFSNINLISTAIQAIEDNSGYAVKHQINLVFETDLSEAFVKADQHRLLQVFSNLISNAVKFSPTNSQVIVKISAMESYYRTTIIDSGEGIPDEFKSRIFQRFAQANNADNRYVGGSGLGLSICKTIIEKHHGKIDYISDKNKGTEFFFDLPKEVIAIE